MAIRRDDIGALPRGSTVEAVEPLRSEPASWIVDAIDEVLPGEVRVTVVHQQAES